MAISTAVHIRTFIPLGWFDSPVPGDKAQYQGDNRTQPNFDLNANVTYRTSQHLDIDFDNQVVHHYAKCGESHKRTPIAGGGYKYESATASADGMKVSNVEWGTEKVVDALKGYKYVKFKLICSAGNPLTPPYTPTPNIDYEITFKVWNNQYRNMEITGLHDGFPAYELWKIYQGKSTGLYSYDPISNGKNTLALFPPMDVQFSRNG